MLRRNNRLIADVMCSPFEGIGQPEALKENLSGLWSRRIDREHRLVYSVDRAQACIVACRYHYDS